MSLCFWVRYPRRGSVQLTVRPLGATVARRSRDRKLKFAAILSLRGLEIVLLMRFGMLTRLQRSETCGRHELHSTH